MKPTLKDALSCASKAHCKLCRLLDSGRSFRASILATFPALGTADFVCPEGKPWDYTIIPKSVSRPHPVSSSKLLQAIAALPGSNEANILLKSLTAQVLELIKENRGGSCQDKAAYRRRLHQKLLYYIDRYGTPELRQQYPFNPPANPLQTPQIPPCNCPKSSADTSKNLAK